MRSECRAIPNVAADQGTIHFVWSSEDVGGELKYLGGGDDSGEDRNAHLKLRMSRGKKYVLRLRLYYADHAGETAVIWW